MVRAEKSGATGRLGVDYRIGETDEPWDGRFLSLSKSPSRRCQSQSAKTIHES